jgi:hypothetical protein
MRLRTLVEVWKPQNRHYGVFDCYTLIARKR